MMMSRPSVVISSTMPDDVAQDMEEADVGPANDDDIWLDTGLAQEAIDADLVEQNYYATR